MMERMKVILMVCVVAGFATVSSAVLVDNFDSYDLGQVDAVTTNWKGDTIDGDPVIEADPGNASNQVISITENGEQSATYCILDSAAQVPDGSTSTVFLRFRISTLNTDQAFGLTSVDEPTLHGTGDWNQFHAMFRLTGGDLDVRDGGSFIELDGELSIDTWYYVWFIVNNESGAVNDNVQMYMNTTGADATEEDLLMSGTQDTFAFRVQDSDTLDRIYWRGQNTGDDKVFFDDIYISNGIDLVNPIPEPTSLILLSIGGVALIRRRK